MLSGAASAQPKAVGPDDVQRQLQMTVISSDWSDTQAFDLDNPVDVPVRIQGVHVPRVGYAELYYKLDLDDAYLRSAGADPDAVYVAIMQEVSTIKSMNLPLKTLNNNRKAVLRGWHATPQNFLSSSFLIDEIKLADSREHFAMHANNPAMDV
ncbi:MAG: hypothetical protein CSA53_07420, partial [Gammaproteobacteria bacterium]